MSVTRLYCSEVHEGHVELAQEEHHHAARVLRLRDGDPVVLFDGAGTEGVGHIHVVRRQATTVKVEQTHNRGKDTTLTLTLAVAMPKTQRQGYLIEKCTELGVASIWPVISQHGVAKPGDAAIQKWRRRAIEACRQSGRAWLPSIEPPADVGTLCQALAGFDAAYVADLGQDLSPLASVSAKLSEGARVLACVGPEGGWADRERQAFAQAGALRVRLAPTILRVETAAIAVCALIASR